jgi:hypothetical protein
MKIKGFCLFVGLLLVSGVSAQVMDTLSPIKKQVVTVKPKTQVEIMADRVKKLKITHQNLVDVKEAAAPTLNNLGIPTDSKDVLMFVDGKEVAKESYKDLNPNDIESVTVLKNQEAIKKLTTKKCTAILMISLKKKAATTATPVVAPK